MKHPQNIVEELYDMNKDPSEQKNLIEQYPKIADELRKLAILFINSIRIFHGNILSLSNCKTVNRILLGVCQGSTLEKMILI